MFWKDSDLIAVQAINERYTNISSPDPNLLSQRGEHGGLHFDVAYALLLAFLQEIHLFIVAVFTHSAISASLTCIDKIKLHICRHFMWSALTLIETIGGHCVGNYGVEAIVRFGAIF